MDEGFDRQYAPPDRSIDASGIAIDSHPQIGKHRLLLVRLQHRHQRCFKRLQPRKHLGLRKVLHEQLLDRRAVGRHKPLGREQALDQAKPANPRPRDAPLRQIFRIPAHRERTEGLIEIPRQHAQLVVLLIQ